MSRINEKRFEATGGPQWEGESWITRDLSFGHPVSSVKHPVSASTMNKGAI